MATTRDYEGPLAGELPDRVTQLLAHPTLTNLPENPVGSIWAAMQAALTGYEKFNLSEVVVLDDVRQVVGPARMAQIEYKLHAVDEHRILRSDTSMPLMIEVAKHPRPGRYQTSGKVYRDEVIDHRHLQAFHQAEILVVDPDANEWAMAEWLTTQAKSLLGDRKLRIQEIDFPFMCTRAFDVSVGLDDEWIEVAAFGRFHDDIAEKLGGKGQRAVGAGVGLERWAQIAYEIDDIRKVESARVA